MKTVENKVNFHKFKLTLKNLKLTDLLTNFIIYFHLRTANESFTISWRSVTFARVSR